MVSPWKAVEQQLFVLVPFRPYPKILRGARRTRKTPSPFYLMLNYSEGFSLLLLSHCLKITQNVAFEFLSY